MKAGYALAALAALLTGCSLGTDTSSEEARVVLTGNTPVDIQMITSTHFTVSVDGETGNTQTTLVDADTVDIRPPFDQTWEISEYGLFLVRVVNADTTWAEFDMRITIDGDTKFDDTLRMRAADGNAASYEWQWIE